MNPLTLIDLKAFALTFGAKLEKDEVRIRLFSAAIQNKAVALAGTGDAKTTLAFASASGALVSKWVLRAKKLNIWDVLSGKDLYKDLREETRVFARFWELDPEFVAAMG